MGVSDVGGGHDRTEQYEHGDREQGDLQAALVGDRHRRVHVVAGGEEQGRRVLGRVADDRQEDHADEDRIQANLVGHHVRRTDQQLAGGVMWVLGSISFTVAMLVGFYRWLEPDSYPAAAPPATPVLTP